MMHEGYIFLNFLLKMKILLKLSGEGMGTKNGPVFDLSAIEPVIEQVKILKEKGHDIFIVSGGGNIFRGRSITSIVPIKKDTGDYLGLLATIQNGLVLKDLLSNIGVDAVLLSALDVPLICQTFSSELAKKESAAGRIPIFVGGLAKFGLTTDTTTVQRAIEVGADIVVMAKNGVAGLYSDDPRKNPQATFIKETTCTFILDKKLTPVDFTALEIARDNKIKIKLVGLDKISESLDPDVGTTVLPA
ncbi:MAG: UMP kinase [Candidatus Paceibacterota bacterium]|jgi:uridylate kinase